MIKLVACPNITKRELMTALMEGRRFTCSPTADPELHIHWDENFGDCPVRCGSVRWKFRGFKHLHEITESHWYDNIPDEGVLCWVWDVGPKSESAQATVITRHVINRNQYAFHNEQHMWKFATPILPSECYQEPV